MRVHVCKRRSPGGSRPQEHRRNEKVSVTLTNELWEKVEQHCAEHKLSRSELIRSLIESSDL
ncbi:ribbon-helix-helix protein, CopG family [Paenibacillus rhizoplanae]|uniref:ribbon-helix-helix protein, CopG family n=1 Tax=Paenibacillus rhizoplanae TaxID=1917181 RepID=UPI00361CDAD3